MYEEILDSTELVDSFPHYSMSDYNQLYSSGSIPNSAIPQSKYSSTETESSSEESGSDNGRDNGKRITVSGFSTSATSSESSRKRRRSKMKGVGISSSCGSTGECGGRLSSSLNLSVRSNMSRMSIGSSSSIRREQDIIRFYSCVPVLNSISDLRHAIGRHRGISGSFTPAIDSTLFAMFFATDIFDGILKDEMKHTYCHTSTKSERAHVSYSVRKDVTSLLRKEIVYSLRMSYFCPASKIVKLAKLLEDNFPLEQYHEPATFLDLLMSKILNINHPPFHTYSNGSSSYVHMLYLERTPHLKISYFQPSFLTIQQLLERSFLLGDDSRSSRFSTLKNCHDQRGRFVTVPYPALVLQVIRKANHTGWKHQPKFPIIPNLEIDLTGLFSSGTTPRKMQPNHRQQEDRFQQSYNSYFNESIISDYPPSSANTIYCETDLKGQADVSESRLKKGLKFAWKVMYEYLENFSTSASDFTAHHRESVSSVTYYNGADTSCSNDGGFQVAYSPLETEEHYSDIYSNSHGHINHLSLSLSSLHSSVRYHSKNELQGSFTLSEETPLLQPHSQHAHRVKMELIAVICYSDGSRDGDKIRSAINNNRSGTSSYFVYCKAGTDYKLESSTNGLNQEHLHEEKFAPWILYQSRYGVAPQVTLIENFGKWICSLERNHEEFNLYEVPLEIRRVLQNSHLLIYKRIY